MPITIPHTLPQTIQSWSISDVGAFLYANRVEYHITTEYINVFVGADINGLVFLHLVQQEIQDLGIRYGGARCIMMLINELKSEKGILTPGK